MMGDLSAKVKLDTLLNTAQKSKNLYALGAAEDLNGEIIVLDSKLYHSMQDEEGLVVNSNIDVKASLLVYTQVPKWDEIVISEQIGNISDLEQIILAKAKKSELDTTQPIPFLIEGTAASLDWHIINWPDGDTEHSHEKHKTSGLHGTLNNKQSTILGFYSDSHQGVFTHHSTSLHMHFKRTTGDLAGHVDGLSITEPFTLKLPKI